MVRAILPVILILTITIALPRALLLYKSSETGYGENILLKYIAPALRKVGEDYDIVNVEKTIPRMDWYDIVVSCFYSPQMKHAKEYIRELARYVHNGGKVFIINNMGAFSDPLGNSPTLDDLNSVFNLLGAEYEYGWHKANLKYEYDSDYILKPPPKNIRRDIEKWWVFSKNVKVVLKASYNSNEVPLVFFGRNGGIAVLDHAFDEKGVPFIDLGKIVREIIVDPSENSLIMFGKNTDVEMTFKNAGFEIFKVSYDSLKDIDFNFFKLVIFIGNNLEKRLKDFSQMEGIVLWIGDGNETAEGTVVLKATLDIPYDIPLFQKKLSYFKAPENAIPIIEVNGKTVGWISKGLIYIPSGMATKATRGILMDAVLIAAKRLAVPVINGFSVFLDDFPLPAYNLKRKEITREFGDITDADFYYKIWWDDMKKVAKDLGIRYISALVTSYNNKPDPPFDFTEFLQTEAPVRFLEKEHKTLEIELHGYNHLPPLSKNWEEKNLIESYKALKAFLKNVCDFKPIVFIAPDNKVDWLGIKAAKKVFHSIKVIGTTYYGNPETTFSEFAVKDDVIILPRTTSGYYPLNRLIYESISTVLNIGTYQYFIHPDDLFSKQRNPKGLTWDEMIQNFRNFLRVMKSTYPWLRMLGAREIAYIFTDYFKYPPKISYLEGEIRISLPEGAVLPRYFFIKSSNGVVITGGKVIYDMKNFKVVEMNSYEMIVKTSR